MKLGAAPRLTFDAGSEPGRAWELSVYADNTLLQKQVIVGEAGSRTWKSFPGLKKLHQRRCIFRSRSPSVT